MSALWEAAAREIRELHSFFEEWFAGRVVDDDVSFARVTSALAEDFCLVSPRGVVDDRSSILGSIRAGHGQRPTMRLWTDELVFAWGSDEACLVRYHEHQSNGDDVTVRLSSALFVAAEGATNGLRWLHVHETWTTR